MDGKRRSRHENGEIVSNNCEEEKLERLISESGEEGGKGSNEGKEERGREKESEAKVGESDTFVSLLLQWFCCWLAGYLGVAFPWCLLVLLLHNRCQSALELTCV